MAEEELGGEDVGRVVVGEADVVEVDPGAGGEGGESFADELGDLAGGAEGVAGVDEEEAAALEEVGEGDEAVLEFFFDEADGAGCAW